MKQDQTAIKIIGRINANKNIYFATYSDKLQPAINNWKNIPGCVKVLRGTVFINSNSLGYFTEILSNNKVQFSVITTLN